MRRAMLLALCAVIFLPAPSFAQQACTEIGCVNGLTISMGQMTWPKGHYTIQFLINNKSPVECKGVLPLKPCAEGPSFHCNVTGVTIGESGCALPEKAHGLSDIRIAAVVGKVVMTITKDMKPFMIRTFKPEYVTSRPNGPQCEPVCTSATVSLNKDHLAQ